MILFCSVFKTKRTSAFSVNEEPKERKAAWLEAPCLHRSKNKNKPAFPFFIILSEGQIQPKVKSQNLIECPNVSSHGRSFIMMQGKVITATLEWRRFVFTHAPSFEPCPSWRRQAALGICDAGLGRLSCRRVSRLCGRREKSRTRRTFHRYLS